MFDIYKASAGSGKTFTLTKEFLKIIFSSPYEYKNVLAVTFTNKATEEMKNRLINELNILAINGKSAYRDILKDELKLSKSNIQKKAILLRTLLLHDYGNLSITTIDSFFQKIMRAFTKELSIYPGYNIELDSNMVLKNAYEQLMQNLNSNKELKKWLSDLLRTRIIQGKPYSIESKIVDIGKELFKEDFSTYGESIKYKLNNNSFLKEFTQKLTEISKSFENKVIVICNEALEYIQINGLNLDDFSGKTRGFISIFKKGINKNFDKRPTATMYKAMDDVSKWTSKTSPNKDTIESMYPTLNEYLSKIIFLYEEKYPLYMSANFLCSNFYQIGILNFLNNEIRNYCTKQGVMMLNDTTKFLNMLIQGNEASFIYEKCGNFYKHIMIDEFQDTSSLQWNNFKPLVSNSLSENNNILIVGDVKQSIYRWRSGDWKILDSGIKQSLAQFSPKEIHLKDNWRSHWDIVNFNNYIFNESINILKNIESSEKWTNTFESAYYELQQNAKIKERAYVDISFKSESRDEDADNSILSDMRLKILDAISRGAEPKDIVILVRGKKEGAKVANSLMEYNSKTEQSIPFISNDSLFINSSLGIQFIIAVLKYIITPYDLENRAALYWKYCIINNIHMDNPNDIFKVTNNDAKFETLFDININNENLLTYSIFETVEIIIDKFNLKSSIEDVAYIIAFQDMLYDYETKNSNSITLFLEWWKENLGSKVLSTSEDTNAVKIVTVHKSKGLEFDIVIIPFCNWSFDQVKPIKRLWCHNQSKELMDLEYAPINYSSKLKDSLYVDDYMDEHLYSYIDNINLLYVAFTRAKRELYIIPYTPNKNKKGELKLEGVNSLLFKICTESRFPDEFESRGEDGLSCGIKLEYKNKINNDSVYSIESYPVYNTKDNNLSISCRYHDYGNLIDGTHSAIDKGKLLHKVFSKIKNIADVDRVLENLYLEGLYTLEEKAEYSKFIMESLSKPQVQDWFAEDAIVINEQSILLPNGSSFIPDRVLIKAGGTYVIDYKFGDLEMKKYLFQVRRYMSILKKMGYNNIVGYIWYLTLDKIVKV